MDDPLCCPVRLLALAVVDVASLVVVQEKLLSVRVLGVLPA